MWRRLGSADSVASHCGRLDGVQRRGCFHGLGYAGIAMVLEDPERIVELCDVGARDDRVTCVEGVVEKLADLNQGRARAACAFIEDDVRPVCEQAAERKMYGLEKPTFTLYYDPDALGRRRAAIGMTREAGRRNESAHHH
jgi:hypothetical protein